jgi:hypothetical protein
MLMRPGKGQARFLSAIGAFNLTAQGVTETLDLAQRFLQRLGCLDALPALECAEIL